MNYVDFISKEFNFDDYISWVSLILDPLSICISIVDISGNFVFVNKAYEKVFDISRKLIIGKHLTYHVNKGEISIHLKVLESGEKSTGTKKMGIENRLVLVEAFPIIINGQLHGSIAIINDFAKSTKIMDELKNAKDLIISYGLQSSKYKFTDIYHKSLNMENTIEEARRAADTNVTVLLLGESGTGKELFAHAIHRSSDRGNKKFLRVNCSSFPESLLESILFGYASNAFTGAQKGGKPGIFEEADKGTLFLDEIGDISLSLQNKLLRVLQEKEIMRVGDIKPIFVDVRVILATNADLESKVNEGLFRKDLFYRINVYPINIPPLRQRKADIPGLVEIFKNKYNKEFCRNIIKIEKSYYNVLYQQSWAGNVRELENIVARSIVNCNEDTLKAEHLKSFDKADLRPLKQKDNNEENLSYKCLFEKWERKVIKDNYNFAGKNKTKTAEVLHLSVRSVYDKLKKYNIK